MIENARNGFENAILINTRPVKTKDYLHAFLTESGLEHIMEYDARKRGSRAFGLFSQGTIYTYRKEGDKFASLRDSRVLKVRKRLLEPDCFLSAVPFVKVIAFFASKGPDGFYSLADECFDLLEEGMDSKRVFANFTERVFACLGFASDYHECPSCGKVFEPDEKLGYNTNMCAPACRECADDFPVLLPGMRRYLSFIQDKGFREAAGVDISAESIERVCAYESRRLGYMGVKV
ncbi:MAG TPA: hypothetical protein DCO86_01860 [Spirochaetaceae bacterium]|nr:hypothetical protein [Spirochaetaceae bacterium]